MYGVVGAPLVNAAREIFRWKCSIELKIRRPVSDELRDSRTTSTRGASAGAPTFIASSFLTSGKAMPGSRISFSWERWCSA